MQSEPGINTEEGEIMIETMTAAETAEYLRSLGMKISPDVIRSGLQDRRFPFGDFIPNEDGRGRWYVYKRLLNEWVAERETK